MGIKESLVGKQLIAVPTPAVILDRAVVRRNCNQLQDACRFSGLKFRPHVKTHKVREHTGRDLWPSTAY